MALQGILAENRSKMPSVLTPKSSAKKRLSDRVHDLFALQSVAYRYSDARHRHRYRGEAGVLFDTVLMSIPSLSAAHTAACTAIARLISTPSYVLLKKSTP
jgi:hypothetical protein